MAATIPLYLQYQDTNGSPLEGGYLYFGTAGQNPITNPITVYWDAALTQPAAQPIRTLNGYPARSGNIANIFSSVNYSLVVKNSNLDTVYSELTSANSFFGSILSFLSDLINTAVVTLGDALIGVKRTAAGAIATTLHKWIEASALRLTDFLPDGYVTDGSVDYTTYIDTAVTNSPALIWPPFTVQGVMSVRKSNFSIIGHGSSVSKLIQPANTAATYNCLELGDTASGNGAAAYTNITIHGMTIDGNRANQAGSIPTTDVTGWGLIMTKISHWHLSDVKVINSYNGNLGIVIDSNFGSGDVYSANCLGHVGGGAGVDFNSSKYCNLRVVSESDVYGLRVLDNCWGNVIQASIYNPTTTGVVYNNQTVNFSYANIIDATVIGGCTADAFQIGANVTSSTIRLTAKGVTGGAMNIPTQTAAYLPHSNDITVTSQGCGGSSVVCYGNNNKFNITSNADGITGAAGTVYSVYIYGNYNTIDANLIDGAVPQMRGLQINAGATGNKIKSLTETGVFSRYSDNGTRSESGIITDYVTVSSAELLALNATAKELTLTPSAGYFVILEDAQFFYDYNSAAYAGIAAGEDLEIRYTNISGQLVATIEATGFLDLTADAYRHAYPATTAAITPVAGAALVLDMSSGEITTGNSPLYVRIRYRIVDAAF